MSMGSSIKINSISIDLSDETYGGKCEHFSIRGFVAEIREKDHRKCWPFSADQSYSLPSLSVLKSRWWRCASCIKDINDSGKQKRKLVAGSSAIPSKRKLIVTENKEKKNDDQTVTLLKKGLRRAKDASTVKSKSSKLASQEQVSKRSKEKANISTKVSRKESREAVNSGETMEALAVFGSSEIAGVVDDRPNKAIKKNGRYSHLESRHLLGHNPADCMTGLHRRKNRKVRLLSELLSNRNKETMSKRESVRGRKRKSIGDEDCRTPEMINYASRILSTNGKTSEGNIASGADLRQSAESQSSDSGYDKDLIKGKQRNRRFQVVNERIPEISQKDTYDYTRPVYSSIAGKELVPCTLLTQRSEKELKAIIDDKESTIITFSDNMDGGKLVKQRKLDCSQHLCPRNTMPQSTRDLLNWKWLDSSFDKLPSSDGHFNKFTHGLDGKLVFSLSLQEKIHNRDDDRAMPKDIGKNYFRDSGSSLKSTNADGCLKTGINVNFSSNRNITRPPFLNDKQSHTFATEVAESSHALQKDIFSIHGNGKKAAVQELPEAPRIQSKTSEHIDDIPMEIVELMARNQYERCLPDREEDKQPSEATTSVHKNALLIDLNETYDNSMDNNTFRQPKPLGTNARNCDAATKERQLITGKQTSLELFPKSQFGQPYNGPSGFRIYPLIRDNQSSSIQFSGVVGSNKQSSHNCQWLGQVPTTMANNQNLSPAPFRVLRACNTCQGAQQQQYGEASHPIWPSSITSSHSHKPVSFNMPQKFMDQSAKVDDPNLHFVDNRKQNCGFVSSNSLDTYSNESSIPAMHLLSLMDPRLRSNIPVDQSPNSNFVKRPLSPVHQSKEFVAPQPGDYNKTAYSTKQWPFDLYSKRATPETPRENFAFIPPIGTSSFSFQSEKGSGENADYTFQASWNHHKEKQSKRKDNNFTPIYNKSHHQKPIFKSKSCDPGKFQLLGASDSMMLPLKFHITDNAKKHKTKKAVSAHFVCSFNRNPADFTIPDAPGNLYMIKAEDLKVRKKQACDGLKQEE